MHGSVNPGQATRMRVWAPPIAVAAIPAAERPWPRQRWLQNLDMVRPATVSQGRRLVSHTDQGFIYDTGVCSPGGGPGFAHPRAALAAPDGRCDADHDQHGARCSQGKLPTGVAYAPGA